MPNPANIRETRIALGYKQQTGVQTKNGSGEYLSFTKINAALTDVKYQSETDAQDIGKINEFPQTNFKTAVDTTGTIEKILSSQFAAWAFGFCLGGVVESEAGTGFLYTIKPRDPVVDGINLPCFTIVEAIRQGGSAVLDRASVGCAINELTLSLKSGPGRQNAMLTVGVIGTGLSDEPSAVTIPALTAESFLNAGGAVQITILGSNYITATSFVSLDLAIRNNLRGDTGYYPGSGVDNGFQVRGRMEHADREHTVNFRARFMQGSDELTKLANVTEGTMVLELAGAAIDGSNNHSVKITYHRVVFRVGAVTDEAGVVTVDIEASPLWHNVNGICTVEVKTNITGIMSAGA